MYIHLTYKERVFIALMIVRGKTYTHSAQEIGVNKSTISREVACNKCPDGIYRARKAHKRVQERRKGIKEKDKIIENDLDLYEYVTHSLEHYWSPQQITGRLKKDKRLSTVSHVTIYSFVRRERPDLKQYLRHKKHRKLSKVSRGQANKRMIDTRPQVVERKKRVGDWEGDTIVGREKTERILTHVDRKSGFLVAHRTQADSDSVRIATNKAFLNLPCRTITYDNGSEFAAHFLIEKGTNAKVYFAYPGKPGQRGCNENTNGLLRQFFPKGTPFATITQRDVDRAVILINNRPRKRLNYRTPLEVFLEGRCVAVQGLM